ncbi:hypothetical protein T440DRAFT_523596 [Plenodomus tracheiphilus IPT5]|uniref:DNA repair protein-like protein Rad26 n=1 Tax=Plenodomus tracheiphilus IPT5 TaxID=1408161 RepID=A0A6A7AQE4_9PLEO|nr:hypothetical protein T440DRAFT_523596 [Plenodomus tracheiphilus IPT5]
MDDDDFDFSDPDLDDLPANTLQHLEASAIRATQHQHQHYANADPESDYGLDDGDEVINLNDTAAPPHTSPRVANAAAAPPLQYTFTKSQQCEYDIQYHEQFAEHAFDQRDDPHQDYNGAENAELPYRSQADPTQLLQRIKKLEQEKAREKRDAEELKGKLQTKSGEADTLRRRHDADARRYERQMADQQQAHSTELARLRTEMEKLRRDKESAQTERMFNQHEAREMGLARRIAKSMATRPKSTTTAVTSPAGTPKRATKTRGAYADGFDDDDIIMASPSKLRDRQKTATPKQIGKRKRAATDQSPIPLPALQLSQPRSRPKETVPDMGTEVDPVHVSLLDNLRHDDSRFDLLHQLLSYPSSNGSDRILEALTQHAFPSEPSKKLSSFVYDALAIANMPDVHGLALHICNAFLDLWKRCQTEKYYAPTSVILDALHFVLACEPIETAVQLTERAVPLIIAFIDLVADPISKAAKGGETAVAALYSSKQQHVASQIDVLDCLELLYSIATSCVSSLESEDIIRFWQAIPLTFACMLLVKEQPSSQITMMLRILSTSALDDTLGPITMSESVHETQISNEDALLNRLTNLFTETPRVIADPSATTIPPIEVSEEDIWDLRFLVLSVLTQFSITAYGSSRLAQNRLCIGRLIKYLDYCITSLYRQPLSPTQDRKVDSINATMKLIYHIATTNADFDIKSKLVNTLGGQHAYLVALTRLAFSEGLVLEHGIEDEVVNMAHDILDEGLSMEEGDAFGKVYSSGSIA